MPVRPYTVAVRLVHSGRYGGDAGDFRLRDAYVESPALVRGYGPTDVVRSDCLSGSASCPGTQHPGCQSRSRRQARTAVPLWSAMTGATCVRYGPLPVDAFVFADAAPAGRGSSDSVREDRTAGSCAARASASRQRVRPGARDSRHQALDLRRHGWSFGVNLRQGF